MKVRWVVRVKWSRNMQRWGWISHRNVNGYWAGSTLQNNAYIFGTEEEAAEARMLGERNLSYKVVKRRVP